jgi:3-hydroxybutyryl-CoA dehydrogenase
VNADSIKTAAVIGAGTMGHGIAQVLSMSGIKTRLYDIDASGIEKALQKVAANLDKGVARGKVTEDDATAAREALSGTTDLDAAIDGVDAVIEAIPERMELKTNLFAKLGETLGEGVLLATNTSSLPIGAIAAAARFPERVTGMHFFNPVHIMKLVEVVRTEHSSDEALGQRPDLGPGLAGFCFESFGTRDWP